MNKAAACIFIIVSVILGGCADNNQVHIATMPLYAMCIDDIEEIQREYTRKYEGTDRSLELETHRFDVTAPFGDGIIGYVSIKGENLVMPIENYANLVKSRCFPANSLVIRRDNGALEELRREISRAWERGVEEMHVTIKSEEIEIFFYGESGDSLY